jgi:catechol 2,3-dioxygenase-like lactoylglutathione lyase family enzyme
MSQTQTPTRTTHVATVLLPVRDQDRALDFYVGKLGLEKRVEVPYGNGDRWIEVAPAGAQTTIALCKPMQGTEPTPITACSLLTEDVDADHAALRDLGVDVDEQVMRMGDPVPPMFFFRDPDGNSLLIVQRT